MGKNAADVISLQRDVKRDILKFLNKKLCLLSISPT